MKKIIALMVTILFASSVNAGDDKQGKMELCMSMGSIAKTIMEKRQQGAELSKMLTAFGAAEEEMAPDSTAKKTALGSVMHILKAAYEVPRWNTSKLQQNAITDFSNEVLLTCIQEIVE